MRAVVGCSSIQLGSLLLGPLRLLPMRPPPVPLVAVQAHRAVAVTSVLPCLCWHRQAPPHDLVQPPGGPRAADRFLLRQQPPAARLGLRWDGRTAAWVGRLEAELEELVAIWEQRGQAVGPLRAPAAAICIHIVAGPVGCCLAGIQAVPSAL